MPLATSGVRSKARRVFLAAALPWLGLAAGCGDDGLVSPQLRSLDSAVALWKTTGAKSYTMQQQRSCECLHTELYTLTVVNDQITSAVNAATHVTLPANELSQFLTVSQLFDRIRTLLATKDAVVTVTYDTGVGYPKTAFLDPSPNIADDEISYTTSNVATQLR